MYWIVVFSASVLGAVVHVMLMGLGLQPVTRIAEIILIWLLAGFYGLATLVAGLQHGFNSDKIAKSIGWRSALAWPGSFPSGSGASTSWLRASSVRFFILERHLFTTGI